MESRGRPAGHLSFAPVSPLLPDGVVEVAFAFGEATDLDGRGAAVPDDLSAAVPRRRRTFLAGRLCAREALGRLGLDDVEVGRLPGGAPAWPAGVVGSISHTDGFARAAVARTSTLNALGIDTERRLPATRATAVERHVLTPPESARTPDGLSPADWIALVFSAKESLYKCLHPLVGQAFYFDDAEIATLAVAGDPDACGGPIAATLRRALSARFPAGTTLPGAFHIAGDLVHTTIWVP